MHLPQQLPEQPNPRCPSTGRHGTSTARVHDGCRCDTVRQHHTRYEKLRVLDAAAGRPRTTPAHGTIRRIHALYAIGWPSRLIAAELGVSQSRILDITNQQRVVRVATATAVADLYRRLSGTRGPSAGAARRAAGLGYQPPIAWDDDTLDDPDGRPWAVIDDNGNSIHRAWPCGRNGCQGWAVAPSRLRRGQNRPAFCSTRCRKLQARVTRLRDNAAAPGRMRRLAAARKAAAQPVEVAS